MLTIHQSTARQAVVQVRMKGTGQHQLGSS